MKVLILIETLINAGAERVVVNTAKAMTAQGIHCEVAILFDRDDLASELEEAGISVHKLHLSYKWSIFEGAYKLLSLIKKNKIDIVHAHLFFSTFYAALAKILYSEIKTVSTFHNLAFNIYPPTTLWKKVRLKMEGFLMKNYFDLNTGCSKAVSEHYKEYLNLEDVPVVYNGFALPNQITGLNFKLKSIFKNFEPDLIAITPGRFTIEKGHRFLIEAVKANQFSKKLGFIFIGDGPEYENIKTLIAKYNLTEKIVQLSAVTQDKLFTMIKQCDMVVLPSISEGFPMIIGESMLIGTPLIATRVSGIPELIENNSNGLLVNPRSPEELIEAIEKLSTNEPLRKALSQKALQDIKKLEINKIAEQWIEIYKELELNG